MRSPSLLRLLALGPVLLLVSCSSGGGEGEEPAGSGDGPAGSGADLPVPTEQICAGLDLDDLGRALDGADLRVASDVVAGETGASGMKVRAPQCSLRGGGRTLDLSVFTVEAADSLRDDVQQGVQASEDQGLQTCGDLSDLSGLEAYDGREAVEYDCELPSIQLSATTVVVRMSPDWRVGCSLSGGRLDQEASRTGLEQACGVLVDSLTS